MDVAALRDTLRIAVQTGAAALAMWFALVALGRTSEAFVGVLSAVLILQPSIGGTLNSIRTRFAATFVGLACADLTARTGNIAAAVGLHFSNNVFATVLIDTQGAPSSGLALWLFPADEAPLDPAALPLFGPWTPVDILLSALSVLVMWLAARLALRV